MDKYLDHAEHCEKYEQLKLEASSLHRRKIILSRIFKLSLPMTNVEYGTVGLALLESGEIQKSIIPLKRASIVTPYVARHQIGLARALFQLEKETEAFSSIKKALKIYPQSGNLHTFLIETLEEKHRLEDLESFYSDIAKKSTNPDNTAILYFEGAEALKRCNKYPQAFKMYRNSLEINTTEDPHYHNQYALALYHEGLFEEAIIQFEHVMRLDPENYISCNNVAYLHYSLGRVEKAREKYEEIIEKGLEIYTTYSNFILLLSHLDQDEEVIDKYKNLLNPYIQSHGNMLRMIYKEALRITEVLLQKDDIDEEIREFNVKKLKGINLLLSLLN